MTSELPLTTSDVTQEVKIRMGEEGQSAIPAVTVMQMWDNVVKKHGDRKALYQKIIKPGEKAEDTPWTSWTWKEYRAKVDAFGKSLLSLGFNKFDTINIIGFNSPEWFMANYGCIAAGGVPAGIYATNGPDACKYIGKHSKAKVIVCDGVKQLEKFYSISKELPDLKAIVMYGTDELPRGIMQKVAVPVYTFEGFLNVGKNIGDSDLKERSDSWKPGEVCTLIYTSGTTGPPKAVMITNDNIAWTVRTMLTACRHGTMDHNDVMISYLPLSHIAAQMVDMHQALETGCQFYFAQADALKGSLGKTLKEVRPTTFFAVPRVWEKIYDKMQEVAKTVTGIKKTISGWAKEQALAYWQDMEFKQVSDEEFSWDMLASVLVVPSYFLSKPILHQVHVALGFDRCYAFYVSAAPIDVEILKYFASLDIPIMELFGQSECCGPHSINKYDANKFGTVGRPLPGTLTKLDEETGELCYQGRHIFAGYYGMPEETKKTVDPDGWLHSGDIADIDDDNDPNIPEPSGFIKITGRIKELIITAGGENVPPVLIETELKHAMPALSNAMVIGDKRKFLTALLCLQVEVDTDGIPTSKLTGHALETAKEIGSTATTTDEAREDPKWKEYFDEGLKTANSQATSRAQNVVKWALLSTDFCEKGGELTPTLKLKRKVTAEKYADIIEAMYA